MGILSYNVSFATQSKFWDGLRWSCLALWVSPNSEHFAIKWVLPLWYIDSCFFFFSHSEFCYMKKVFADSTSFAINWEFCHALWFVIKYNFSFKVSILLISISLPYNMSYVIYTVKFWPNMHCGVFHTVCNLPYSLSFATHWELCHTVWLLHSLNVKKNWAKILLHSSFCLTHPHTSAFSFSCKHI